MNLFSGIVLLGVLLACAVVGIWWKKSNVLEILVLGVSFWFSAWVVAGMGLFVLDAFRLFRCACATAGLIALTGIAAILVRRLRDHTPWKSWRRFPLTFAPMEYRCWCVRPVQCWWP